MPKRRFAIERGGPKRLELRWKGRLKELRVELDGQVWAPEPAAVRAGTSLTIPGGSTLFVQQVKRKWWSVALRDDLRIELDGVPVPGSDGDPSVLGRRAARLIALFGLVRLLAGYALVSRGVELSGSPGGAIILCQGAALMVLALLAGLGLRPAVVLSAGLLAIELVASLVLVSGPSGLGTLIQVLVMVHLFQVWRTMKPRAPVATLASVFE